MLRVRLRVVGLTIIIKSCGENRGFLFYIEYKWDVLVEQRHYDNVYSLNSQKHLKHILRLNHVKKNQISVPFPQRTVL